MATLTKKITITDEQIKQYQEDGAICLRNVIPLDWVERLSEETDKVLKQTDEDCKVEGDPGRFAALIDLWKENEFFYKYAFEGPCAQIADALMGSHGVRYFADQMFVKDPGTLTPTPWHNDQAYWPATGQDICSIWVPMEAVNKLSSGLEYVKGSHRWNKDYNPEGFGSQNLDFMKSADKENIPDIDADPDKYELLSWDMEPGDCLVHNSLTIHGAGGNKTNDRRRRAIATRWFGKQAYFKPGPMYTPELIGLEAGQAFESPYFPKVPLDSKEGIKMFDVMAAAKAIGFKG